jgi:ABC-2 type transport system ATP-binding protein
MCLDINFNKKGVLTLNVLEVKDLHKSIGRRKIIKGISFSIKEGEIFGFLGRNGAGKTTTIRMLVGLIAPNSGSINILGYNISENREAALKNVGAVVESPELYGYLTGRENLMQLSRIYGNLPLADIEEVIELVGLKDRINDKVRKYSLGMKQRLGLAEALLSKPKLLILDEPTNGLDPNGIIEFRNIIKKAAKERQTSVLISSHILSEIEQLCDTVAFIDDGVIKSIENIAGKDIKDDKEIIFLSCPEIAKASEVLKTLNYVNQVTESNGGLILDIEKGTTPILVVALTNENLLIEEVYKKRQDLEERYMQFANGGGIK